MWTDIIPTMQLHVPPPCSTLPAAEPVPAIPPPTLTTPPSPLSMPASSQARPLTPPLDPAPTGSSFPTEDYTPLRPRKRQRTNLSSECNSFHDVYLNILHLINNGISLVDAMKQCGLSRTTFYRNKCIAEVQIVDRTLFTSLLHKAVANTKDTKEFFNDFR